MKKKIWILAISLLLIWNVVEYARIFPHYLTYFNEFIGNKENAYQYLAECNLDWGQDLPGLAGYLKSNGNPETVLCYFGTGYPKHYQIEAQEIRTCEELYPNEHMNSLDPEREILAVSASALAFHRFIYDSNQYVRAFAWLERYRPMKIIGNTIFLYDITNDAGAHLELGRIFFHAREYEKAVRECQRAIKIIPESFNGYLVLGQVYRMMGRYGAALEQLNTALAKNPSLDIIKNEIESVKDAISKGYP